MANAKHVRMVVAVAGLEPVAVAATVRAIWVGAMFLRRVLVAPVRAGLTESGGVSAGGRCLLRKVNGPNESNGSTWRVVANGGHGSDDGLRGGNPLLVDRFDDVDWRGVCETRWWWVRWVKTTVAVTVFVPRGSCGGADG